MRKLQALALALPFLLVMGCQEQSATGVSGDQALAQQQDVLASQGQPGKLLPLQGNVSGGVTGQTFAPGFPVTRDDFGGRCSVPSDWVIEFTVTGPLSHLGQATVVAEHCSQIDFLTGAATYGDGMLRVIAANGDELWGSYDNGTSAPNSATEAWFLDTFILSGGTGRFANAAGGGTEWGTVDLGSFDIDMEMRGVISYDASDRRH